MRSVVRPTVTRTLSDDFAVLHVGVLLWGEANVCGTLLFRRAVELNLPHLNSDQAIKHAQQHNTKDPAGDSKMSCATEEHEI